MLLTYFLLRTYVAYFHEVCPAVSLREGMGTCLGDDVWMSVAGWFSYHGRGSVRSLEKSTR